MSDKLDQVTGSWSEPAREPRESYADGPHNSFNGWNDDRYAQEEPEIRADRECSCGTVGQHDGTCWTCKLKADVIAAANAALWGACTNKDKCQTCAEVANVLGAALDTTRKPTHA